MLTLRIVNAAATTETRSMAELQGATSPGWLARPRRRLFADVIGGPRQNWDKLVQLASLVAAYFRPAVVRQRLERLRALGHIDAVPTVPQLLVAGHDQMIVGAAAETKLFYKSQGIPWVFHNLRRFLSGPATMLDPIGLFAPRDALVEHVLQTFHRHPVYDLVLLRAHEGGVDELPRDIAAFEADPHVAPRPIPEGLVGDPMLMLAMDQFKDVRGFARYATRLRVGWLRALFVWLSAGFDESAGAVLGLDVGGRRINIAACDPEIVARHRAALDAIPSKS